MKNFLKRVLSFSFVVVSILPQLAYGSKTVSFYSEGETAMVNISKKDLNLIKFPIEDVKVFTKSRTLDVKVSGKNIMVSYMGGEEEGSQVAALLFVTPGGSYSMILKPSDIPSETVVVQIPKSGLVPEEEGDESGALCLTNSGYIQSIKELLRAMFANETLSGFSAQKVSKEGAVLPGLKRTLVLAYRGLLVDGEKYRIVNVSGKKIELLESDFHKTGVLAVSLEKHVLEPLEEGELYLVKKASKKG